jgi:hypothetical protein
MGVRKMDLREYYINNVQDYENHSCFLEEITNVNKSYNIFDGVVENNNYKFNVKSEEEAIREFKNICQKNSNYYNQEDKCWFYLLTYYLMKMGYEIKEFPELLRNPPTSPEVFISRDIMNKMLETVPVSLMTKRYRNHFIEKLTFKKVNYKTLNKDIESKFVEISTRSAGFNDMTIDEQLSEIVNLIENYLKKNDKFINVDYSLIALDFISEDIIRDYKGRLQCFRHASEKALNERKSFSEDQKLFMREFGIIIIETIHKLLK